jgi:hypothetical protein
MLGKTEQEILALPVDEFRNWVAYFQIKEEEERKAIKRGNKKKLPKGEGF